MSTAMNKVRISLIGIDGSGKSTHLYALLQELHNRGLCCKYINLRGEYFRFISVPFLIVCKLVGREGKFIFDGREYHTRHPYFGSQRNSINDAWTLLFLVDICVLALLRGYFSTRRRIILVDRCIIDSIVDLMASLRDDTLYKGRLGKLFLRLMKPRITVLLDLEEEEALDRGQDIPGLNYLRLRRPLYKKLSADLKIPIINSDRSFDIVHQEIIASIKCSGFI